MELSSAHPGRLGRVVELITVLQVRLLATESITHPTDILGLYGVATGILEDAEWKPISSKPAITATSRGLAWPLVHVGRA